MMKGPTRTAAGLFVLCCVCCIGSRTATATLGAASSLGTRTVLMKDSLKVEDSRGLTGEGRRSMQNLEVDHNDALRGVERRPEATDTTDNPPAEATTEPRSVRFDRGSRLGGVVLHYLYTTNIWEHQLGALTVILGVGILGAAMPYWLRRYEAKAYMDFANCFASGAFMGLALFNLLPEAQLMTDLARIGIRVGKSWYNLTYVLAFCGYITILFFEKILYIPGSEKNRACRILASHCPGEETQAARVELAASQETAVVESTAPRVLEGQSAAHDSQVHSVDDHSNHIAFDWSTTSIETVAPEVVELHSEGSQNNDRWCSVGHMRHVADRLHLTVFSAAFALSIHSVFEGMIIGVVSDAMTVWVATLSIVSHKWASGFAIASNCTKQEMSTVVVFIYLGMFTMAAPLGIGLGIPIKRRSVALAGIFNSLSLGTILYLGTNMVNNMFSHYTTSRHRVLRFSVFLLGSAVVLGMVMLHIAFGKHTHWTLCPAL